MYTTFLASAFRSIRFGINEAHGRGVAMQLNYLLDQGAFVVNADGTFAVDAGEDQGGRDGADARDHDAAGRRATTPRPRRMLDTLGVIRPQMQTVLDRLKDVPVDIAPRFPSAETLLAAYRSAFRADSRRRTTLRRRRAGYAATTSVGTSASRMTR